MLWRRLPEGNRESSLGRVAGVFDNPPGFPCTPPGVDILEGGKLSGIELIYMKSSFPRRDKRQI